MNSSASLLIREATEADLPAVVGLYAESDLDDDASVQPLAQAQQIVRRFRRFPEYKLYVAIDHDEVVGSLALLTADEPGRRGAPAGVIEDVVIEPSRRGEGIGAQMMTVALECCRGRGCRRVARSSTLQREGAYLGESFAFAEHGHDVGR